MIIIIFNNFLSEQIILVSCKYDSSKAIMITADIPFKEVGYHYPNTSNTFKIQCDEHSLRVIIPIITLQ